MWTWLRLALELCGSALAPDACAACDEPVPMLTAFCPACAQTLVPASRASDGEAIAPFLYGGALAVAIGRFKYEGRTDLARHLSAVLLTSLRAQEGRYDVVVPVPLHPSRLAARGYNQASLLASPVARALGARFDPVALRRLVDTPQQAKLDREARRRNVAGAFQVAAAGALRAKRALVIDDVCTTGATLAACASAAFAAGAASVTIAAVARVEAGSP